MITNIESSGLISGYYTVSWLFNGEPNILRIGSGDVKHSILNKLIEAQCSHSHVKTKVKYVKTRNKRI